MEKFYPKGHQQGHIGARGKEWLLGAFKSLIMNESEIHIDRVSITNAQIKALRATPKVLVAAPGAGYFVSLVKAIFILNYGSNALTESEDNLVIEYSGGTDAIAADIDGAFMALTHDSILLVHPVAMVTDVAATVFNNIGLQLKNTGDGEYAGNAALDTTMEVIVEYRIHKTGL